MANEEAVKELVRILSQSRVVLSSDVTPELLKDVNVDLLASKILEQRDESKPIMVLGIEEVKKIMDSLEVDKAPVPIEVIRQSDFKPYAAQVDARYAVYNKPEERAEGTTTDFVNYFNSRLAKTRHMLEHNRADFSIVKSLELLKGYAQGRDVGVVGLVKNKFITKKGNLMVELEDETGDVKVMFMNGTSQQAKGLFEKAGNIINDETLAVKGKFSSPFLMATDILWPDVPIKESKRVEEDVAIAFMSDIHVGSKKFMEKQFYHMIQWLNGNVESNRDLAGKIKYIVMAGDVADGIGVYPGQERDLAIQDIYTQYKELFNYIDAIPDYIHVFLLPGNHDAVQRAEPQPTLGSDIVKDFKRSNVHLLSNPSNFNAHGMDVLTYHGTSLDSMIAAVPGLSYAHPEKAMIEVLRRRHISPIYGGNVIVPSKEDNLVIDKVPDILHMGHIHKNGIANYHGVEVVNSGTWQARTDFQMRQGHIPSPCILPVYEMKSRTFTSINFSGEL